MNFTPIMVQHGMDQGEVVGYDPDNDTVSVLFLGATEPEAILTDELEVIQGNTRFQILTHGLTFTYNPYFPIKDIKGKVE